MAGLWVKKTIEQLHSEAAESEHGLRRALGPLSLVSFGIGAIVGAGIFVLSGDAAQYTGPALVLSVILCAIGCAFAEGDQRSEEHTSELQSRPHLVCRL